MLPPSAWSIVETIAADDTPRRRTARAARPTSRQVRAAAKRSATR